MKSKTLKMNKKNFIFLMLSLLVFNWLVGQDTIMPLWSSEIPDQIKTDEKEIHEQDDILWITNVQEPVIEVYLPTKQSANGQAVLIFPGGGYHGLAYDWEGTDIAKMLNYKGIAGIVVKYRLPLSKSLTNKKNVPLQDAQRAFRIVKSNASKWNISENEIGIIGFSAGGHLAATLGVHYNDVVYERQDAMDDLSAKPSFMALIYPVITFNAEYAHMGSRVALLGEKPSESMINYFSNELSVDKNTAPTFLLHAVDDTSVPVENSLLFFKALKKNNVPVEMHIYPKGGHGFSLAVDNTHLKSWTNNLFIWLESLN